MKHKIVVDFYNDKVWVYGSFHRPLHGDEWTHKKLLTLQGKLKKELMLEVKKMSMFSNESVYEIIACYDHLTAVSLWAVDKEQKPTLKTHICYLGGKSLNIIREIVDRIKKKYKKKEERLTKAYRCPKCHRIVNPIVVSKTKTCEFCGKYIPNKRKLHRYNVSFA